MIPMAFLQIGRAVPTTPWELVSHSSTVTKFVLIILAVLSLLSWAVMFLKWREFRRVSEAAKQFVTAVEHVAPGAHARAPGRMRAARHAGRRRAPPGAQELPRPRILEARLRRIVELDVGPPRGVGLSLAVQLVVIRDAGHHELADVDQHRGEVRIYGDLLRAQVTMWWEPR